MTKRKKRVFSTVEEIFKRYIPDYVPTHLRESKKAERKDGGSFIAEFTSSLLNQFKEDINRTRSS